MRIFVLVSRVPFPLDKGDKLRIYHQIKELSKTNTVHLCCLDDNNTPEKQVNELRNICAELTVIKLNKAKIYFNLFLALFSNKPYQVHYFYQSSVHKKIKRILQDYNPDKIYCQLIRTAEYVKREHNISKTIDYMDAFSKGIERRIANAGLLKPIFKDEAKRLLKYEHLIFDYFEGHTIISKEDRKWILHEKRDQINIVSNGIDTDFFSPKGVNEKEFDLIFVGNMSYAPNVAAVKYLAMEILPLLNAQTKLLIAGASPSKEVLRLANDQITVSGWLDDIRDAYKNAKVFVAPLFIGTGLQNKLLEAMSMELPCVTTSLVNSSLKGEIETQILIANDALEFKNQIEILLAEDSKRSKVGKEARTFVKENYSWKQSTNLLETVLLQS